MKMLLIFALVLSGCTAFKTPPPTGGRNPASIQKVFDYSYLQGEALQKAVKDRLMRSVQIKTALLKDDVTIEMGNFVLLNDKKEKDFACGFYDRVTLIFDAEGVSVDGEAPHLSVETGCEVGGDINVLIPIRIPLAKLKSQKPSNTEFKFFESKASMTVKLSNSPADWPKRWILKEVKMTHSKFSSRVITMGPQDMFQQGVRPISMNW